MVEDGALHLLIDLMVLKDGSPDGAGNTITSPGSKNQGSILPTPPVEWSGGTPAAASDELVVPPLEDTDVDRELAGVSSGSVLSNLRRVCTWSWSDMWYVQPLTTTGCRRGHRGRSRRGSRCRR